jgi:hypothetical protein
MDMAFRALITDERETDKKQTLLFLMFLCTSHHQA